jgi:hypothetical protein
MKKIISLILAVSAFTLLLTGCDQQALELAELILDGIEQERADSIDGFLGTVEIHAIMEEGLTPVDQTGTREVVIKNSGTADLIINDMSVYLRIVDSETEEVTGEYFQDIFGILEGTKPDLPVAVPPGSTLSGLYVWFSPEEAGDISGVLSLETNAGEKIFRLAGTGAWELGLEVTGGGGKIVEPIEAASGEGRKVYYSPDDEVTLTAESAHPLGLRELDRWAVVTGFEDMAYIDGPELISTTVTLSGHADVEAEFIDPYVYVAEGGTGDYTTIQEGVDAYNSDDTKKGVCVAAGTYDLDDADRTLVRDVVFRGGYASDFSSREYKTPEQRSSSNPAYHTIINTGDDSLTFPSAATDVSLLEGFEIIGASGNRVPPVYADGSNLTIRYNTITAPSGGYAIGLEGSDALIENNTIYGADGGLQSVGVYVFDNSDPVIKENTITAGNPTEAGGESIAIYVDWFSNPVIDGNTLTAGSASGNNGKSVGVYSINSSSPVIKNNTIDAGYGETASYFLYFSYAGWPVIDNNIMFSASDGEQDRYGVFVGPNGRIESITRNNLYGCPDGYAWIYQEEEIFTSIGQVNDRWVPDPDDAEQLNISEEL